MSTDAARTRRRSLAALALLPERRLRRQAGQGDARAQACLDRCQTLKHIARGVASTDVAGVRELERVEAKDRCCRAALAGGLEAAVSCALQVCLRLHELQARPTVRGLARATKLARALATQVQKLAKAEARRPWAVYLARLDAGTRRVGEAATLRRASERAAFVARHLRTVHRAVRPRRGRPAGGAPPWLAALAPACDAAALVRALLVVARGRAVQPRGRPAEGRKSELANELRADGQSDAAIAKAFRKAKLEGAGDARNRVRVRRWRSRGRNRTK